MTSSQCWLPISEAATRLAPNIGPSESRQNTIPQSRTAVIQSTALKLLSTSFNSRQIVSECLLARPRRWCRKVVINNRQWYDDKPFWTPTRPLQDGSADT